MRVGALGLQAKMAKCATLFRPTLVVTGSFVARKAWMPAFAGMTVVGRAGAHAGRYAGLVWRVGARRALRNG
jgi:hypothetical protein